MSTGVPIYMLLSISAVYICGRNYFTVALVAIILKLTETRYCIVLLVYLDQLI